MRHRAMAMLAGALAVPAPAFAQPPGGVPPATASPLPRARGPLLDVSVELARAAIAACAAQNLRVTALVADSAGVPVAMLSADGVSPRTQAIAPTKVAMVLAYREPTSATLDRSRADPALAAALAADPRIGTPRAGGLPLLAGGAFVGAIAVSGAPKGEQDEACARAAVAALGSRLR